MRSPRGKPAPGGSALGSRRLGAVVVFWVATFPACALVADLSGLRPAETDGGMDAAAADSEPDTNPDVTADVSTDRIDPCPSLHGPEMALIEGMCIDRTEVSKSQYLEFFNANLSVDTSAPCGAQTSYKPLGDVIGSTSFFSEDGDAAAMGITWCQARDYCRWAGKSLCGASDGGALVSDAATSALSAWYRVCSQNGLYDYPYGDVTSNTYASGYCNVDIDGSLEPSAAHPKCAPGDSGVYALVGNVEEWLNACDDDDAGGSCVIAGGDWLGNQFASCHTFYSSNRYQDGYVGATGIRCCNPPK